MSLRFDDNLDSHVNYVVPVLNKYRIKATFMVNPGRNNLLVNYKKNKKFWESELPKMGHKLGNHTWRHKGARSIVEAVSEISSVSELIWNLYPGESKLNVFASGGGEKWGGQRWHRTFPEYREIPGKYYLIDLYDGKHRGIELNLDFEKEEINKSIDNSIKERKHLAFIFHKVGSKNLIDHLRKLVTGFKYTFDEDQFLSMIKYLDSKRNQIWLAPLIQILKYEEESKSAELAILKDNGDKITMELKIKTDPDLYDHDLSLKCPVHKNLSPRRILQGKNILAAIKFVDNIYICNIKPINSEITIFYE